MKKTTSDIAADGNRQIDCSRCFARMTLKRTEDRPLGYELRIYECMTCDLEHQLFVAMDPMKSPAADWANSSLKAPD